MKKVTVKTPAKLNLTLDILGTNDNYHQIESLVASISLYDVITAKSRSDGKITLTMKGLPVDCTMFENNAYKTAKLFVDTFKTNGVDLIIEKNIPVAGGLGGSSADIAGTLNALNKLYELNAEISALACEMGSDANYMLTGGYAVLKGRGEIVERSDADRKIHILLITDKAKISARSCYKKFDDKKKFYKGVTEKAEKLAFQGDLENLFPLLKNDLGQAANDLAPDIKHHLYALKRAGAQNALVCGSGPTVFGVYFDKKSRDESYKKLVGVYGKDLIKAETVVMVDEKFV